MPELMVTVWGNPLFGCELASFLSRRSQKAVAVFDADLLCPTIDIFFGVCKTAGGLPSLIPLFDEGKIDSLSLRASCVNPSERLYTLAGNYNLENYEYYTREIFTTISEEFRKSFDITIFLVNKSIYDLFTILSLNSSDINIAAVECKIQNIREYNSYIEFIKNKQGIPSGKTKFVSFNKSRRSGENEYIMEELTSGNYLGKISSSKIRDYALKEGKSCLKYIDKRNEAEYLKIARRMGVICPSENKKKRVYCIEQSNIVRQVNKRSGIQNN